MVRERFLILALICCLIQTSLLKESKSLDQSVYKQCSLSGDGWIFCIGSRGGSPSYPSQADGCFASKDCDIVVQAEQLKKPDLKRSEKMSVLWQIFVHRGAGRAPPPSEEAALPPQVPVTPVDESTNGTRSLVRLPRQAGDFQELRVDVNENGPGQNSPGISITFNGKKEPEVKCFVSESSPVPLKRRTLFMLDSHRNPQSKMKPDDDSGNEWDYYRFLSPRKLVCNDYRVNINVGAPEAMISVSAQSGDKKLGGPLYRMWSETEPKVEGTRRKSEDEDIFGLSDETSTFVAIAVCFIVIALIIVGGLIYVFQRRAKRRREQSQFSSTSGISSYSTTSGIKSKSSVLKPKSAGPSQVSKREPVLSTDLNGKLAARRLSSLSRHQTIGSEGPTSSSVKAGSSRKL